VGLIFNAWEPTIAIYTPILAYCKNYLKWFSKHQNQRVKKGAFKACPFFNA
jgi:hypothetical protein